MTDQRDAGEYFPLGFIHLLGATQFIIDMIQVS